MEREMLDQLLEELDARGRKQHAAEATKDYWVCQRRHPRYAFHADCTVRFLTPLNEVLAAPGRTRNLSRGGLGLLVKRVLAIGDPIEVELRVPGQPVTYMAGLIQFIRYAGKGYHEAGVALRSADRQPIFSHDPVGASQTLEWLPKPPQPVKV